jgi:hypothetical protein
MFTGKKASLLNTSGMENSQLSQISTFGTWDDVTGENNPKELID